MGLRIIFLVVFLVALTPAAAHPKESLDPAVRALRHDSSLKVRTQAALVLGQRGGAEAVAALVEALLRDDAPAVRMAAASALGRIGQVSCADALEKARVRDRDARVRSAADRALSEIASRGRTQPSGKALFVEDAHGTGGNVATRQALHDALGRHLAKRGFSVVGSGQPAAYRIKPAILSLEVAEEGNRTLISVRASAVAVDRTGRMAAMLEGSTRLRVDGHGLSLSAQARLSVQAIEAAASSLSEDLAVKLE